MRWHHALPFALLLGWQIAPQRSDSTPPRPRLSVSLGYAFAQLEDYTPAAFDCYGNQVSAETSQSVEVRSTGGRLDFAAGQFRATGFAGRATSTLRDASGDFSGFQLAWEGPKSGFGAGASFGVPFAMSSTSPEPNLYFRIGAARRVHLLVDYMSPSETFGAVNFWRAGLARDAAPGGSSWFAGGGQTTYGSMVGVLDLALPMSGGLDLLLHAHVGPGHVNLPWGLALGARFSFPK